MKILIVDDHALFREGLRHILSRLADDAQIFEAGSIEAGLALGTEVAEFDLILLDLYLPGAHGLDGLKGFRQRFPASPVVLLSGMYDAETVREGIARGAQGFIPKAVSGDYMLHAARRVLDGELWVPEASDAVPSAMPAPAAARRAVHLTPRQIDVLARLCEGDSNKEIGRALAMS